MQARRCGFLGFVAALLPLLWSRRSCGQVPVAVSPLNVHPGPWPGGVRPRRRHWCGTCALLEEESVQLAAMPGRVEPSPSEGVKGGGPFSPEAMAAAQDARMARWLAERPERARARARMICEGG